jgi:hypothetical protein
LWFRTDVFCNAKFFALQVAASKRRAIRMAAARNGRGFAELSSRLNCQGGGAKINRGAEPMTPRDQQLLDKQLRRVDNRPAEGVLMIAVAAVFFAGMAVGGFLFGYTDQPPLHLAANDIAAQTTGPLLSTTR